MAGALTGGLFAVPPAPAQETRQFSASGKRELQVLTAEVVRFNRAEMVGTYEGDLIVRVDGSGQFVHLVYSPYDFGFESPPAELWQILPSKMTSEAFLVWTFMVHRPWNFREQGSCNAARAERNDESNQPSPLEGQALVAVPGAEGVQVPPFSSLSCLVIQSWSGGEGRESGDSRPEQAER